MSVAAESDYDEVQKTVTLEVANDFMEAKISGANKVALSVAACILSPVLLIFLIGLSEVKGSNLSEQVAVGIGLAVLLLMVGAATVFFVMHGMKMEPYEYLEKEVFRLEYGVEGIVRKKMADFEGIYRVCIIAGIVLCFAYALPLITASVLNSSDFLIMICVDVLLIMVACSVFLFVMAGEKKGCFQMLLQEGEYTAEKKQEKKRIEPLSVIYWSTVTAVYLGVSFYTGKWTRTWMIWPCAGVMFAAVQAIAAAWRGSGSSEK